MRGSMGLSSEERERLITAAKQARDNAYTPVHDFPVGAAVLDEEGGIHAGCNVESVIPALGTCAERNAIGTAASQGSYRFRAVAVVAEGEDPVYPCGACRQVLTEFQQLVDDDITVIMAGTEEVMETPLNELHTNGHGPEDVGVDVDRYR